MLVINPRFTKERGQKTFERKKNYFPKKVGTK